MNKIIELLEGYGFQKCLEDASQNKVRFQNEDTFIDVWDGKKGITVGLYNPKTKKVKYQRRTNCESIENLIIKNQ